MHIATDQMDIKTNKEEPFMLHNDHETGIVIYPCTRNLQGLFNEVSAIFIDGTFKYCPKFFLQIYNNHGLCNGRYLPLVFTLLPENLKTSTVICGMPYDHCVRVGTCN